MLKPHKIEKGITKILDLMAADNSFDAPADSVKWAQNLFAGRALDRKPSVLQKIKAALSVELAPGRPAFGERSAAASMVRQLLFNAEDNGIDIRLSKSRKTFELRGQILGGDFEGANVNLCGEKISLDTIVDESLEFKFSKLPAGIFSLTIQTKDKQIVIDTLEI